MKSIKTIDDGIILGNLYDTVSYISVMIYFSKTFESVLKRVKIILIVPFGIENVIFEIIVIYKQYALCIYIYVRILKSLKMFLVNIVNCRYAYLYYLVGYYYFDRVGTCAGIYVAAVRFSFLSGSHLQVGKRVKKRNCAQLVLILIIEIQ